jgi:hypothetical protein
VAASGGLGVHGRRYARHLLDGDIACRLFGTELGGFSPVEVQVSA